MQAISFKNEKISIKEPFKGLLHKGWFAMKLIKIIKIIG